MAAIYKTSELTESPVLAEHLVRHFKRNHSVEVTVLSVTALLRRLSQHKLVVIEHHNYPLKKYYVTQKSIDLLATFEREKNKKALYAKSYTETYRKRATKRPDYGLIPIPWGVA